MLTHNGRALLRYARDEWPHEYAEGSRDGQDSSDTSYGFHVRAAVEQANDGRWEAAAYQYGYARGIIARIGGRKERLVEQARQSINKVKGVAPSDTAKNPDDIAMI